MDPTETHLPATIEPVPPGDDLALFDRYDVDVRPLRTGPRVDVVVREATPTPAIDAPDFVDRMRWFFSEMDREIDVHVNDPIATAQALARVEALLADVRYVRDRLTRVTAESLRAMEIRRLTVSEVVTVEASSDVKRTDWQHEKLLAALLTSHGFGDGVVNPSTGERWDLVDVVALVLGWLRPEWKVTGCRESMVDPDRYCTIARDDDGKVVRTPAVKIVDNRVRGQR